MTSDNDDVCHLEQYLVLNDRGWPTDYNLVLVIISAKAEQLIGNIYSPYNSSRKKITKHTAREQ